jgi:hypothetical protein
MTTAILLSAVIASVALTIWLVQRGGRNRRGFLYRLLYGKQFHDGGHC